MKTTELIIALSRPKHQAPWPDVYPEDFAEKLKREGLAEQLYFYHQQMITDSSVLEACKAEYIATLSRNMLFSAQLDDVRDILKDNRFMLLKGIYLIQEVYPDPGLRRFSDMDILVPFEELDAVDKALCRAGYHREQDMDIRQAHTDGLNSMIYRPPERARSPLHVHWHLLNSIMPKYQGVHLDINQVWEDAIPLTDGGYRLSDVDLLIHLCEHAMRHSFYKWLLIRDIAQVFSIVGQLDMDMFCRQVVASGLQQPVRCTLDLVAKEVDNPLPSAICEKLSVTKCGVGEKIFMSLTHKGHRYPELCNLVYWSAQPNLSAKIRFIWRGLFPQRALLAQAYGKSPEEITPATYMARLGRGMRYFFKKVDKL